MPSLKDIERIADSHGLSSKLLNHGAITSSKERVYSLYPRISKKRRAYL